MGSGGLMNHPVPLIIAAVACLGAPAQAGPCGKAIAKFEAAVRQSAGEPNAGPYARESIGAHLHHQPPPASIKQAQARARSTFDATLARAKPQDARGDRRGCMRALTKA